jgi:hypothetical protein
MYTKSVKEYVSLLYNRRHESKLTGVATIEGGNWQPIQNECHENVNTFCAQSKGFTPVRGWLYFDLPDTPDCVMFLAHSVVKTPDGFLSDITPQVASQRYPFLEAKLNDEEFFAIGKNHQDTQDLAIN